ncbi:hypothetical protein [Alicyclobacillus fastidiosus]|uniref:Uncharacterized protein n=1 Tax=Alicyclobacillus fastidiosus TaxID=392011 RepID=A0ABV5AKP6_9BACL|nr:hypothetical protein [Alicyclobacillus fastidiosus]WEH08329.1 hypothetical protein PYS47_16715 [Alicyclobacillus fastidiosus]
MLKLIATYYAFDILLIVVAILFTWWRRKKRLRSNAQEPSEGFIKTDEISVDPTTGIKQQVWFDPHTGERHYKTLEASRTEDVKQDNS